MNLNDITSVVREELIEFDKSFSECIDSEGFFIDDISSYAFAKQGKKIRPLLTLLAAKMCGDITPQTYRAALIIELLHTASLIHDDVLDQSNERRGRRTISSIWGNNTAILFGDYLYGKCLDLIVTELDFKLMPIYARIGKDLPSGELLQKEVSENSDYSIESYMNVISKKTASLLQASAEIGAITSFAGVKHVESLKYFGYFAGLAFQIKDDILDFSYEAQTGKPFGNDIREKKITLPLILLLNDLSLNKRNKILDFIKRDDKTEIEINTLIEEVIKGGYLKIAEKEVKKYCTMAEETLIGFENVEIKYNLINLLYFLTVRKN